MTNCLHIYTYIVMHIYVFEFAIYIGSLVVNCGY